MDNFTLMDGVIVSIFSMSVVFIVLVLLSLVLSVFSKVITSLKTEEAVEVIKEVIKESDEEELLVAKIIAGCLIQESGQSNIKIKSIKRVG